MKERKIKMLLGEVQTKEDLERFYKQNNLATSKEKHEFLSKRMGVLHSIEEGEWTDEERLISDEQYLFDIWSWIDEKIELNWALWYGRLRPEDIVRHHLGKTYKILYFFEQSSAHKELMVMYCPEEDENNVRIEDYLKFMRKVDKRKYPDSKQTYRFEIVS